MARGQRHGFALLGPVGWDPNAIGDNNSQGCILGLTAATALILHQLDSANSIEVSSRLGADPEARMVLRQFQDRSLPIHGFQQMDGSTTWTQGNQPLPTCDEMFRTLPRFKASTACICLEPNQTPGTAERTLKDLNQDGLKIMVSSSPLDSSPDRVMRHSDYLVTGPWTDIDSGATLQAKAQGLLKSGVFLLSVAFSPKFGVARCVRGAPSGAAMDWPAPTGPNAPLMGAGVTAAMLHSLRQSYDSDHTLELATAAGWLASHSLQSSIAGAPLLDLLGTALRLRSGRISPAEAVATLRQIPADQNS